MKELIAIFLTDVVILLGFYFIKKEIEDTKVSIAKNVEDKFLYHSQSIVEKIKMYNETVDKQIFELAVDTSTNIKSTTEKLLELSERIKDHTDTLQQTNNTLTFMSSLYQDTTDTKDLLSYIIQRLHSEGKVNEAKSLYEGWNSTSDDKII